MIIYRKMKADDIPAALKLCRSAGWNQVEADWQLFLKLAPDTCLVAVDDDEVVGTVEVVNYENHFSWIGMVLVDPSKKRQGIGTALLNQALEIVPHDQTVKLDATPAGREVYLKLDFVNEYPLRRMHIDKTKVLLAINNIGIRQMEDEDFNSLLKSDQKVFGADREAVLQNIFENNPTLAFVIDDGNEICGYCFGRIGHHYVHIGPLVAHNIDDAKRLVAAALGRCNEAEAILDICNNDEFCDWLNSIGFTEQRRFTRMYRGRNAWPGRPNKQFAILGPEFG